MKGIQLQEFQTQYILIS